MRRLVVLLAAVVIASCSNGTPSTSSDTTLASTTTSTADTSPTLVDVATTSPAVASTTVPTTTTTSAPTTTTTNTAPSATTTPPVPTADVAAVFIGPQGEAVDFWLPVGYWDGSDWVQIDEEGESGPLEVPAATGDPVRVTGLDLVPTATSLGASGGACFYDDRIGFAVGVDVRVPRPPGYGFSAIGVVGDWEIQPRPASQVGFEIDEYRQIGATFADDLGVDGTIGEVVQVVRSDLDGDGMEEVLVTFEYTDKSVLGAPGDYSIVYLRTPQVGGPVEDAVVFSWYVPLVIPDGEMPFMVMGRVLGVADLNGDGRMEVAVHTWYYEGAGVIVFEFDGDSLTYAMGSGCGG
jgi:hypothetical protein